MVLHVEKTYNVNLVNLRVVEAMACGSLVLAEPNPVMREFFEDDKEIGYFQSLPELQEKIRYYRAHPEIRRKVLECAAQKVRAEFDLEKRLQEIFEDAQLSF